MTTPDDPAAPGGEPAPARWDAPPQPPAWDRPAWDRPAWDRPAGERSAWDRPAGGQAGWGPPPPYAPSPYDAAPPGGPTWGGQPAGGWAPPQTEGKAVAALVLAIVSWVMLPFLAAVVALLLAGSAKRDIVRSQGRLAGAGIVTAARVVAWANVALCLLVALVFVLFFLVFASAGFS